MFVYYACILKHLAADTVYDVGIIYEPEGTDLSRKDRELVYSQKIIPERRVDRRQMNKYLRWKLGYFQITIDGQAPTSSRGFFTNVQKDFDWIKSVLDVEVDFHLGSQECLRAENRHRIKAYQKNTEAGYGVSGLTVPSTPALKPWHKEFTAVKK